MYMMDCQIGTVMDEDDWSLCAFDSSTSVSSVFAWDLAGTVIDHPKWLKFDETYQNLTEVLTVDTLGLQFKGWTGTVDWCIGNYYDPDTNVCLDA